MKLSVYVDRLEKMLTKHSGETCTHCPVVAYYGNYLENVTEKDCEVCIKFVGLKYSLAGCVNWKNCPCFHPNAERAVARAWKKIKEYREKTK